MRPSMSDLRLYLVARVVATLAQQIQLVAISWHIFRLTHSPLALGYVGLAQFLPSMGLVLVTGAVADRYDRARIVAACYTLLGLCALALAWLSTQPETGSVMPYYAVLFVVGVARAFAGPATQALLPLLVSSEGLARAVAQVASAWQVAVIAGPALGGWLYGAVPSIGIVYLIPAVLLFASAAAVVAIRARGEPAARREISWSTVLAGLAYIRDNPVLLGAISLDLLAVLLGGAIALLPAVAHDILHADATGLGALRGAQAVGALLTGLWLARHPVKKHTGMVMLAGVFGFGLATMGFGLSRSLPLSVGMLVLTGATDMVSMSIRQTLIQLRTPQEMRGRVSAVNLVFVGASNELGEFESGLTAQWLGIVPAIIVGGIGTCLVVVLWAWWFRSLREYEE
ncbi:MAG: MFS transporter [Myxococcales bacterium]|nr:MAG: MFS transporter [Myxococcales bacterium]